MPRIPDDNLNYPVYIEIEGRFGSGFYINFPRATWLITAKHVLFGPSGDLIGGAAKLTSFTNKFANQLEVNVDLIGLRADGNVLAHVAADVAAVKIGHAVSDRLNLYPQVRPSAAPSGVGITGLESEHVRGIDNLGIGNDVYVFGYPASIGVGQIEPKKPLIRRGCIAGVNALTRSIIVDAPVYQGNSGGLVIEVDYPNPFSVSYHGLGVVSQFCPFVEQMQSLQYGTTNTSIENSGYAIAEPMDKVFELLGEAMPSQAAP